MIFLIITHKIKCIKNIGNRFLSKNNIIIKYLVNILKNIILFLILINILIFIFDNYSYYFNIELFSNIIPSWDKNDSILMNLLKWWPSIVQIAKINKDKQVNDFITEAVTHADKSTVENIINEANGTGFLSSSNIDYSDFISKLIDLIFKKTMEILLIKPVEVQGYFDDLIGQRMFIEIILFILCISIILLFIFFIFNLIFLLNKDKIIKKFNNKLIIFYIKYQVFLSWITLFFIPILIFISLLTLCHGLHWLITNQIPYENLEIDLHKFISSSNVLILTLNFKEKLRFLKKSHKKNKNS